MEESPQASRSPSPEPAAPNGSQAKSNPKPKKPRHASEASRATAAKCFLQSIPTEMLAETLAYTTPIDLLALARTSKYLCNTLVDPSNVYMWRRARKQVDPAPVPDPPARWKEPAYASWLFDPRSCKVS